MVRESYTLWVCVDCWEAHHFSEADMGRPVARTAWSIDQGPHDLFPGLRGGEHATDCPVFPMLDDGTRGDFDGSQECECERHEFSSSSCDGCGSVLAGGREAFTLVTR